MGSEGWQRNPAVRGVYALMTCGGRNRGAPFCLEPNLLLVVELAFEPGRQSHEIPRVGIVLGAGRAGG